VDDKFTSTVQEPQPEASHQTEAPAQGQSEDDSTGVNEQVLETSSGFQLPDDQPQEARHALDGVDVAVEEHVDVQPDETDDSTVGCCTDDVPGTIEVRDAEMEVATPAQPDDERESGSTQKQTHSLNLTVFTDLEAYHEGIQASTTDVRLELITPPAADEDVPNTRGETLSLIHVTSTTRTLSTIRTKSDHSMNSFSEGQRQLIRVISFIEALDILRCGDPNTLHFDSVMAGYWHSIASGHITWSTNGRSASKVITYYDLLLLYLAIHHIKAE
jgi:hypothetical protein